MFDDLYDFAGEYRTINIEKSEMILGGLTVKYSDYQTISNDIKNIIDRAQNTDVDKFSKDDKINYIADLMTELWKIHSFREGNTRCVIIQVFKENSSYVRKTLVAASFEDEEIDVKVNKEYLLEVIRDIFI